VKASARSLVCASSATLCPSGKALEWLRTKSFRSLESPGAREPEEPVREKGIYFGLETLRRPGINADIRPEESVSSMVDVVKRMRTSAER
jgi:hypothetical protein